MDSDNFSNVLGDWEILKFLCEEDNGDKLNNSVSVDFARWISNLEGADVLVALERLVGESGI